MKIEMSTLLKFPKEGSEVTTGVLLLDENSVVTGHNNGLVVLWQLSSGKSNKLYECSEQIETIACSRKKELVIGSHDGEVAVLSPGRSPQVVRPPSHSVHSRVWRSVWVDDDTFLVSSTYGELSIFQREKTNQWTQSRLVGHSNSVFGVGKSMGGLLATGDYFGNVIIWAKNGDTYESVEKLKVQNAVEDISWYGEDAFAVISSTGQICFFERGSNGQHEWKLVFEVRNATSSGASVCVTEDGKTVFGGTSTELIQFDTETQQIDSISVTGAKRIFSKGEDIFVLTFYGLLRFKRVPIEVRSDLIKYKYVKVSLVGHTGVGKSTLCSFITTGSSGDIKSTLGKKVWDWELPPEDGLEKRIILHDHGGQETVLGTFMPFLSDSDIILILFQQNDLNTFNKALKIYDMLEDSLPSTVKVFFIQTYIDQDMAEFNEKRIDDLIRDHKILGNLMVCPRDGKGVDALKKRLSQEISWDTARTMIQTTYTNGVLQTILALQEKNISAVSLEEFIKNYEKETGLRIPKSHLKFLLGDYSNQGVVEYDPKILDLVIFNEPEYNRLKTAIPIFMMKKGGIAHIEEIRREFKDSRFLPVIDAVYLKHRIAIENYQRRIFPELLPDRSIEIPEHFVEFLNSSPTEEQLLPDQRIDVSYLIEALSEMKLQCVTASQQDGLFSWEDNGVLYYMLERAGNAIDGFYIKCDFRVGGMKEQICAKLKLEFVAILERLFGPFLKEREKVTLKKKVDLKRDIIYDVAISYASEQVVYARQVADLLRSKGIAVFFDKFYEGKMWGRDIPEYIMNVYYKQSRYCIMFISKDYVSKAWPTLERQNAVARHVKNLGDYILPVRFDDSEVPGLPTTIKYLSANEKTPAEIAALFVEKLEKEGQ